MSGTLAQLAIAVGESVELSIVLKATLVLGLTLVVVARTRPGRAAVRHLLLASSFGVLVVLPMAAATVPAFPIQIPASVAPSAASTLPGPTGRRPSSSRQRLTRQPLPRFSQRQCHGRSPSALPGPSGSCGP